MCVCVVRHGIFGPHGGRISASLGSQELLIGHGASIPRRCWIQSWSFLRRQGRSAQSIATSFTYSMELTASSSMEFNLYPIGETSASTFLAISWSLCPSPFKFFRGLLKFEQRRLRPSSTSFFRLVSWPNSAHVCPRYPQTASGSSPPRRRR